MRTHLLYLAPNFKKQNTVNKSFLRTPRNYDGTAITTHSMQELLPHALARLGTVYQDQPNLIMAAWSNLVGPQVAAMTHAVQFKDAVLWVNVRNAPLYDLLCRYERIKLLRALQAQFPRVEIRNITFRRS